MAKRPILTNIPSGFQSAQKLAANFDNIESAFDNTLSRDGSGPNNMQADIDMDSNRIINLPEPVSDHEPVRLADLGGVVETLIGEYAVLHSEAQSLTDGEKLQARQNIEVLSEDEVTDLVDAVQDGVDALEGSRLNFTTGQSLTDGEKGQGAANLGVVSTDVAQSISPTQKGRAAANISVISYDTDQTLSDGQKNTAAANAGAVSYRVSQGLADSERLIANTNTGSLSYLVGQSLTGGEKGQGAANLGVVSYVATQSLPDNQKLIARNNIGAAAGGDLTNLTYAGIGPDSSNPITPFDAHAAQQLWNRGTSTTRAGGAYYTTAIVQNVNGSGTFGPGALDAGQLIYTKKNDWLTTTVEGEVGAANFCADQGRLGDTSCIILTNRKVRTPPTGGVGDNGGATPIEMKSDLIDYDGDVWWRVHAIVGGSESLGAVSGGKGYGFYTDTRIGTAYAAFFGGESASSDDGYLGPNNFDFLLAGSTSRNPNDVYFRVQSGSGTIDIGKPAARVTINQTLGGGIQFRNAANGAFLTAGPDGAVFASTMFSAYVLQTGWFTVATAPSPTFYGPGVFIGVVDGAAGDPCMAMTDGTDWLYSSAISNVISAT